MFQLWSISMFTVKNSGISCLALIFNLSNPRVTILIGSSLSPWGCWIWRVIYSFLFLLAYRREFMAWRLRQVAVSLEIWVQFPQGAETLSCPSAIYMALSPSLYWHSRFCIAVLSMIFSLSNFVSGDLALTGFKLLAWTSDYNCFGALGVEPGARTLPHVLAWTMGSDYSYILYPRWGRKGNENGIERVSENGKITVFQNGNSLPFQIHFLPLLLGSESAKNKYKKTGRKWWNKFGSKCV